MHRFSLSLTAVMLMTAVISSGAKPLHAVAGWSDANGFTLEGTEDGEVIIAKGTSGNGLSYARLPSPVGANQEATLHFSFRIEEGGHPDLNLGYSVEGEQELSRQNTKTSAEIFTAQVRIVGTELHVRDGGVFRKLPQQFQEGVWYQIWMTAHNQTDTYELRIRSMEEADPVQIRIGSQTRFAYRTPSKGRPLQSLVLRANKANSRTRSVQLRIIDLRSSTPPQTYALP